MIHEAVGTCLAGMIIGWGLGLCAGFIVQTRNDADAAIAEETPAWWKRALIDAEARAKKAKVK